MTSLVLGRVLPSAQFNRSMEDMIEKENPDKSVAWPRQPTPSWAVGFRPKTILDLGSGRGSVTSATLVRLAQWDCLGELKRIVLVERDNDLHSAGAQGLKNFLEIKIQQTLHARELHGVKVEAHVRELCVVPSRDGTSDVVPLAEVCPKADLILASHVTYYFGDGSGTEFVDGLVRHRLFPGGRLWVNIRDLNCPAYKRRRALLSTLGVVEPQPFDYSEHFDSVVIPALLDLRLLDKATIDVDTRPGSDRARAVRLIMWRADLNLEDEEARPMIQAAAEVSSEEGPVYSETQFILAAH
jgi:hypothetical protein